jgi:hypothetical protein
MIPRLWTNPETVAAFRQVLLDSDGTAGVAESIEEWRDIVQGDDLIERYAEQLKEDLWSFWGGDEDDRDPPTRFTNVLINQSLERIDWLQLATRLVEHAHAANN